MNKPAGTAPATFDLLDAPLEQQFDNFLQMSAEARFAIYKREMHMDPVSWRDHKPPDWAHELDWREFQYSKVATARELDRIITDNRSGIYIFYVRPEAMLTKFPCFALYVGISNERDSHRPLRARLKQYLPASIMSIRKRENIHQMIRMFFGNLWVAYAVTDRDSAALMGLEETLHGFIHPLYGRRDYPTEVKSQQKAWGVN